VCGNKEVEMNAKKTDLRMLLMAIGVFCILAAALALIDPALYQLFKDLGCRYAFPLNYDATLIVLIPLYLWYRRAARTKPLREFRGESLWPALGLSLLLFALPMAVRVLHNLYFESLDEKVSLAFLVLLTVVLGEGYAPSSFGFSSQKLPRHLALGLFLYIVFGFVTTLGFTAVAVGVNPFKDYDLPYFLLYLPSQLFAVALAEEALFRGYIQTKMGSVMGPTKAIFFQAILFGLWHTVGWIAPLNLGGMAFHFASGFLFGVVQGAYFRHTRNLAGPVLLHGLTNAVSGGATVGLLSIVGGSRMPYMIAGGVVAIAVTVLLAVLARRVSTLFGVLASSSGGG
jgi:membrane protease YdiL (CAAX protease family)